MFLASLMVAAAISVSPMLLPATRSHQNEEVVSGSVSGIWGCDTVSLTLVGAPVLDRSAMPGTPERIRVPMMPQDLGSCRASTGVRVNTFGGDGCPLSRSKARR